MVGENEAAIEVGIRAQLAAKARSVEDVVSEDQCDRVLSDEVATDDERLRQTIRNGLFSVGEFTTEVLPVTEQFLEMRQVVRGADDEYLTDPRRQQRAQRIVDHRLVVHGHELLAHGQRQRMQACAGPAGEDDPLSANCRNSRCGGHARAP